MRIKSSKYHILIWLVYVFIMIAIIDDIVHKNRTQVLEVIANCFMVGFACHVLANLIEVCKEVHLTPKGVTTKLLWFKWFRPWSYYQTVRFHVFFITKDTRGLHSAIFFTKQKHTSFFPSKRFHCKYFHPFSSFYIIFPRDGAKVQPGKTIMLGNRTLTIDKLTEWGVEIENVEEAKKRIY